MLSKWMSLQVWHSYLHASPQQTVSMRVFFSSHQAISVFDNIHCISSPTSRSCPYHTFLIISPLTSSNPLAFLHFMSPHHSFLLYLMVRSQPLFLLLFTSHFPKVDSTTSLSSVIFSSSSYYSTQTVPLVRLSNVCLLSHLFWAHFSLVSYFSWEKNLFHAHTKEERKEKERKHLVKTNLNTISCVVVTGIC